MKNGYIAQAWQCACITSKGRRSQVEPLGRSREIG
jgi:hypothetical protein